MKVIEKIAQTLTAYKNCEKSGNPLWFDKHYDSLQKLTFEYLPTGSGFDGQINVNIEDSTSEKIVIDYEFHHMDEYGSYSHWGNYRTIAKPSFIFGLNLNTTGGKYTEDREYVEEVLYQHLIKEL